MIIKVEGCCREYGNVRHLELRSIYTFSSHVAIALHDARLCEVVHPNDATLLSHPREGVAPR